MRLFTYKYCYQSLQKSTTSSILKSFSKASLLNRNSHTTTRRHVDSSIKLLMPFSQWRFKWPLTCRPEALMAFLLSQRRAETRTGLLYFNDKNRSSSLLFLSSDLDGLFGLIEKTSLRLVLNALRLNPCPLDTSLYFLILHIDKNSI